MSIDHKTPRYSSKQSLECLPEVFLTDEPLRSVKAGPPLEAILVIFGRRALIFFCLKALGKK